MSNLMEEQLWDYIDGRLDESERTVIENLIASDEEWRARYGELLEVQQWMAAAELEEPSMRFTKNVMDEIGRQHIAPATSTYINKNIIRGLAIFFISMVLGFLVYGFGQIDFRASGSEKLPVDLSQIDYGVFFNNNYVNGFMVLNMILGLWLLDQYLTRKKKSWQQPF